MINNSLWLKGIKNKANKKLTEDKETEILIIGGGITGLTTAYLLKNKKIILIDRGKIGKCATSNSTGKLTYLQDNLVKGNKEKENLYLNSQIEAIKIIKNIIIENNIKCNYESNSSYLFATTKKQIKQIKQIEHILKRNNINYKVKSNENLYNSLYSIKINDSAVINPAKYILEIKNLLQDNITIYENSNATDFEYKDNHFFIKVNNHIIKAKILIVATHYPFLIPLGLIPFKTHIEKSYLIASQIDKNKKFNAIAQNGNHSLRYYSDQKDYLVYCSQSNKLNKNINNEKIVKNIFWELKTKHNINPKYIWSNCDIKTTDNIPYSGKLETNLYIATGFSSWGLTNGTISAKIIADLIQKKENPYIELFNPNRFGKITKIIINNFSNAKTYIINKVIKNYTFYNKAEIFMENNIRYGKYTDENNIEHIVYNKCPHMKCNLVFNEIEKTWDCPCHSSRFDIDGNILRGPSNYSIKVEKK